MFTYDSDMQDFKPNDSKNTSRLFVDDMGTKNYIPQHLAISEIEYHGYVLNPSYLEDESDIESSDEEEEETP